jgi:aspartate oxidase
MPGAGVNHKKAVELLVSGSWNALQFLKRKGVRFDNTLHIEACHSEARIWHIEDKTGLYIAQTLSEKVKKIRTYTFWKIPFVQIY